MRADISGLIETQLHRRVRSFMSANDPEAKLMVEVFVLDAPPPEAAYAADESAAPEFPG